MTRTVDDLRGALRNEADAAAYPDVDALVAGAQRRVVASRRRRLAVLGAATAALLVVGGVAVTRPTHRALPQPAGMGASSQTSSAEPSPTTRPTAFLRASQSTADARAYGIDPAVAALPIGVRVRQYVSGTLPVASTQASTPEGLWLVSRADGDGSADLGAHPELAQYGELLLMAPDRSRILRAYPFRGVPPQWLLVTPEAVYCGRQGDGALSDETVCRVDRSTGALRVAVFPSTTDSTFGDPQSLAGRLGTWRLAGSNSGADFYLLPSLTADGLLFARDPNRPGGGKPLRLDPVTLK